MILHQLSLVNDLELKDVTKLPYLYPTMPLLRYKKLSHEYTKKMALKVAENVAKAQGCFLLPVSCIHHKRRDQAKRVVVFGKSYYLMHVDDITDLELAKLKAICEYIEDVAV